MSIKTLVEKRSRELGLSRQDVVRRAGYVNLSKGYRRLDALLAGDLHTTRGLIDRLAVALDVPVEVVTEAVEATQREIWAQQDAAWRASFRPHAVILTEHERPTSITMAAFSSADRQLRVEFEPGTASISYLAQTLRAARQRSPINFYGKAVGFIINYAPDNAIRYDLNGNPLDVLSSAYRPEELTISIRGRPVSRDALAVILGT